MGYPTSFRREVASAEHGLTLGWLLAIAIGGGVLLFFAIGMLLSWRLMSREEPVTTAMQEVHDRSNDYPHRGTGNRLTKRKYMLAASTSRISLTLPPVLPPLPTYNSFGFFSSYGRKRSRSWVDEDRLHGPKVNKSIRESWIKRDSWFGRAPTLPSVAMDSAEKGEADGGPEQTIHVQKKRQSATTTVTMTMTNGAPTTVVPLKPSLTVPALPMSAAMMEEYDSPTRGRVRVTSQAYVRASVTDSNLKHILMSTEQRLREGKSRSPTKNTPRSSPTKGSPVKTPHSHRTADSYASAKSTGTVRIKRTSTSPSKRATLQSPAPFSHSGNASVSSIGSAANSLIAEASRELELPGGLSSPSRLRGSEWEKQEDNELLLQQQQQQQQQQQKQQEQKQQQQQEKQQPQSRQRSRSLDSDASSSLSTLYSVGEQEDNAVAGQNNDPNDPFVGKGTGKNMLWELRQSLPTPKQRTKAMSELTPLGDLGSTQSLVPPPLRPMSLNIKPSPGQLGIRTNTMGIAIAQSSPVQHMHVNDEDEENIPLAFPACGSLTSMVTPSVTTDDDASADGQDDQAGETPKAEWMPRPEASKSSALDTMSPSTAPSSPYNEQDILSLLLSSSAPRRALPIPPMYVSHADENVHPTPLSPRPRHNYSPQIRKISDASHASSVYDDDDSTINDPGAVSTGSPSKRNSTRSPKVPHGNAGTVGSAIAELRRMNSIVSSYSVASIASTIRPDNDSPSLPALRGGGFSPNRTVSKTVSIGRQNYLSVGTPRSSRQKSTRRPTGLGIEIREDDVVVEKKNKKNKNKEKSQGLQVPHVEATSGLRDGRRSANLRREPSAAGRIKLNAVEELVAGHKRHMSRASVESLGLYDKDGFLMSSPERETKGRFPRM